MPRHRTFLITGLTVALALLATSSRAQEPGTVTLVGSFQSELSCSVDWQPACAATHLAYDATDLVWQGWFTVPAGDWEYKVALDNAWDENYPAANRPLYGVPAPTDVKFYYSHATHWVADSRSDRIVTAPGSYQSALGCGGDWQPDCLRSWLQDPDGDGTFTLQTTAIPTGIYEVKATIAESWVENYGAGGAGNGANISFGVAVPGTLVTFTFVGATNVLTVTISMPVELLSLAVD